MIGLIALQAGVLYLTLGAAAEPSSLVPASRGGWPDWLAGPFNGMFAEALEPRDIGWAWFFLLAAYLVVLLRAHRISPRLAIGAIAVLHLTVLLAPPLGSADVFGYLGYARLGALHDLNPYTNTFTAAAHDDVYQWIRWHRYGSPYGPLFTFSTYALAPLPIPVGMWSLKVLAAAGSAAIIALVWTYVQRAGRNPVPAALLVGANPLLLVHGVGGAHNDLLIGALAMGAVGLVRAEREPSGAATAIAATAMKPSFGILLAFLLLGARDRRRAVIAAAATGALVAVLALALFGSHGLGFRSAVITQRELVALHSVPSIAGMLLGFGGVTDGLRVAGWILLAATLAWGVLHVRRTGDWVSAAGWATVALLVASVWLLPWYIVWVLALAAIAQDRRLVIAAVVLTAFMVISRNPLLWPERLEI